MSVWSAIYLSRQHSLDSTKKWLAGSILLAVPALLILTTSNFLSMATAAMRETVCYLVSNLVRSPR